MSAGLLLFRRVGGELEVLLVHPGGPYWARKDAGSWSIPKGECATGEDLLGAARREFREETGLESRGDYIPLAPLRQPSGKVIHAWAVAGDADAAAMHSNTFALEWPPRSGETREFPEVDRAAWFGVAEARRRILAGQAAFLDQLVTLTTPR